jgi:hypothetical protein
MEKMVADRWSDKIDELTASFRNEFGNLPIKRLNWKPNSQTWSIAQNIDHLIVINESYYPILEKARNKSLPLPWIANFGFVVNFLGKTVLKAVHPERRKKIKTFRIWEPSSTEFGEDIFEKFARHQEALKKMIRDSQDLLQNGVIIHSPANRHIVYTLDTAFDIIVTHEFRHLEQARESITMKPGI